MLRRMLVLVFSCAFILGILCGCGDQKESARLPIEVFALGANASADLPKPVFYFGKTDGNTRLDSGREAEWWRMTSGVPYLGVYAEPPTGDKNAKMLVGRFDSCCSKCKGWDFDGMSVSELSQENMLMFGLYGMKEACFKLELYWAPREEDAYVVGRWASAQYLVRYNSAGIEAYPSLVCLGGAAPFRSPAAKGKPENCYSGLPSFKSSLAQEDYQFEGKTYHRLKITGSTAGTVTGLEVFHWCPEENRWASELWDEESYKEGYPTVSFDFDGVKYIQPVLLEPSAIRGGVRYIGKVVAAGAIVPAPK